MEFEELAKLGISVGGMGGAVIWIVIYLIKSGVQQQIKDRDLYARLAEAESKSSREERDKMSSASDNRMKDLRMDNERNISLIMEGIKPLISSIDDIRETLKKMADKK